ncbi:DUF1054 family protein [Lacticaseibacillus yichunensis]|uniref:DUF1054 family protein n=1 Tax=Lacticaseibacillus yichunensis TaxID=2486015 RepID=A0ABW4CKI5_9LACO|nr:DUF1054 family protein [Lacticaseibacillus yichunensis]
MFTTADFTIFEDPTLAGRLGKIRTLLDPKFVIAGQTLANQLAAVGLPMQTVHLAKHLRRHNNPPPDTWLALATSTRGYKMQPHIEVGLWDDRLFVWLALLQESKATGVQFDLARLGAQADRLPTPFELSGDHTQKAVLPLDATNFAKFSQRYATTQKGELLIGQTYLATDPLFAEPDELWADIQRRVGMLAPLYAGLLDA